MPDEISVRQWQEAGLEDAPPGFSAERAESIKGLHVYCPEDAGKPLVTPQRTEHKSHNRKEQER